MNINYEHYRVFYQVAKCGSLTQAAAELMNNQPNITRIIKSLESELGCTLFVRSNKGVTLTPEGEKLYRYVAVACRQIELAESEISLDKTLQKGAVSIAASEVALHGVLLAALEKYHTAYPGVRIKISNGSTPQAIAELKNGIADLAVVTAPTDIQDDMKAVEICSYSSIAVGGAAYEAPAKQPLTLREMAALPLVSLDAKTKTYERYARWFAQHGLPFAPDMEVATTDQLLPMIRHGLGVGFVPEMFVNQQPEGIVRFALKEPIPSGTICLVTHRHRSLSIAAKRLCELLCTGE